MRRGFATKPLPWPPPLPTRIGLAAYNLFAEFASPLYAAHAYRRAGRKALEHAFTLNAPPRPRASYLLWVHGASIGETRSTLPLVRKLLAADDSATVLITASTPAALARLAMEGLGPRVLLRHRPHDGGSAVRRFLAHWRPSGLLLVESELWPNLIVQTRRAGVPIALVNARLSARSLARWMALAPAGLRYLLGCCSVALAHSPQMATRLRDALRVGDAAATTRGPEAAANVEEEEAAVRVCYRGDLKQLRQRPRHGGGESDELLRTALGGDARLKGGRVWLAASTHEGEEEIVLAAHSALRRSGSHDPGLLLILVPRHTERGAQVAAAAAATLGAGAEAATAAAATVARRGAGEVVGPSTSVYVCDTLGELPQLYGLCGVAFVGGSLIPLGGHSVLEAAQSDGGCSVLHGPHTEVVEEAVRALASSTPPAAKRVTDAAELMRALGPLLADEGLRTASRAAATRTANALEAGVLDATWRELGEALAFPLPSVPSASDDQFFPFLKSETLLVNQQRCT